MDKILDDVIYDPRPHVQRVWALRTYLRAVQGEGPGDASLHLFLQRAVNAQHTWDVGTRLQLLHVLLDLAELHGWSKYRSSGELAHLVSSSEVVPNGELSGSSADVVGASPDSMLAAKHGAST